MKSCIMLECIPSKDVTHSVKGRLRAYIVTSYTCVRLPLMLTRTRQDSLSIGSSVIDGCALLGLVLAILCSFLVTGKREENEWSVCSSVGREL